MTPVDLNSAGPTRSELHEPTPSTPVPPGGAAADPRRWRALGVLALVQFMLVLDITVVNVALPHIQVDLGFSRAGLAWVVDGYVLTAGGLLLLGGRLADLLGRRRMFFVGVGLFALASVLSGAAVDPAMLVASRFAQGAGEALAAPAAFGLVALLFPDPAERTKAIGIFSGVAGLGGTLGPVLSGLLISGLSWRWIFFINIPVAVFATVAVGRMVNESRADRPVGADRHAPDWQGALLGTAGLGGVIFGLIHAATKPWGSISVLAPLLGGLAVLGAFVVRERTAGEPLVPRGFFSNRTRVTANLVTLFFTTVFFTLFFLLTLYMQQVHGYSALRTGVAYLPIGLTIGMGIGLGTALLARVGTRVLLAGGFGLVGAGMLLLGGITVHGSYASSVLPGLVVIGFGSGLCFVGFGNAAVHGVSRQDASLASGVQNASLPESSSYQAAVSSGSVAGRDHLVVPYTLDTNDMRLATAGGFSSGIDFEAHLRDAFDVLWREGEEGSPKMLSVGLHGRLVGRPGRLASLERFVDHVLAHERVWVCRRVDIARHWVERFPVPVPVPGDG